MLSGCGTRETVSQPSNKDKPRYVPDMENPDIPDGSAGGRHAPEPERANAATATPADAAPTAPVRGLAAILIALMLAVLLAALDQTIVSTALPTIVSDLGGLNHLSWVVTAYLLASTVSTPLWGKLGDLYGRKRLFQAAIVIFLGGSALCGLASSMGQLIAFRGLQGLGGGGLMVLAIAIIGDVVPTKDLGRYQGVFGAVFGVASVIGPLLGGYVVDQFTWPWVFYINLPVGIIALAVIATVLPLDRRHQKHTIDYLGAVLLSAGASCLVLLTTWGGTEYAWGSAMIIGLGIAGVALLVAWVYVERRAVEPIIPLALFRLPAFSTSSAIGFIVGFAMFGALTYLPLYLQVVHGVSATVSGVYLLPMVLGMLLTSVSSGQIISRTGHYKAFPISGMAITTLALVLLSTMDENASTLEMSTYFFVLGTGLGLVMQVLVIIVQNAVDYRDLGTATSGVTFFRSIGGSFGTAVFGTIFANRLTIELAESTAGIPQPPGFNPASVEQDPQGLDQLPTQLADAIRHGYAAAIDTVFLWAAPVAVLGFVIAWFVRELPLRGSTAAAVAEPSEGLAGATRALSSREELERCLSHLMQRDSDARALYARLGAAAGLDLSAGSIWVLARLGREGRVDRQALAQRAGVTLDAGRPHVDRLVDAGLVIRGEQDLEITPAGRAAAQRLYDVRRRALAREIDHWDPESNPELTALLSKIARESVGDDTDQHVLAG